MATKIKHPKLSVVVMAYDMDRELPRTLESLSSDYQHKIAAEDYEVLVVDNGSPTPFGEERVKAFGPNFNYHYVQDASPSPAGAMNLGVDMTDGEIVCLMIDGARLVTPGLLQFGRMAFSIYDDPIVGTVGWHLGPIKQQISIQKGYNQILEDRMLENISWPNDGYRLYEISSLAGSSPDGWFSTGVESNTLFMKRSTYTELGGFDTAFDMPGGGLVNLDIFRRACERSQSPLVMLLGEGSFHQLHGGVSTNVSLEESNQHVQKWGEHYQRLRGIPFAGPQVTPVFLGVMPPQVVAHMAAILKRAFG